MLFCHGTSRHWTWTTDLATAPVSSSERERRGYSRHQRPWQAINMRLQRAGRRPPLFTTYVISSLMLDALLLRVVAESTTTARLPQTFAIEPADRTAITGDTVVLPCRVLNMVGALQWTRDGFGLGSDRNLKGFPRYSMVGSDEEGDFSLQITSVSLDDDALFQCQVGASEGIKGIRSRSAVFTVYVPPEPPKIVQGDFLRTIAGMTVVLTCESHAGKPPAELTWLDGEGNVVSDDIEYTTQLLSDGKRANAVLKWTFTPRRDNDRKTFTCRSENPALKQPQYARLNIEVKYPPEITLKVNSEDIKELDNVKFTCESVANPSKVIYKWYRNEEIVVGDHITTYIITRITRDYNQNTITCEVSNAVGSTKESHTLNILYGPQFRSTTESVAADEGAEVQLNCDVDGNPTPGTVWTFNDSSQVLSTDTHLVIPSLTPKEAGKYTCRASVAGFPQISTDVRVFIKGPPKVWSPTSQYGTQGEIVKVECLISSVPPPTRVLWSRNNQHVDIDNNEGYEIIEEPLVDGVRNLLVIHDADEDDFGQYNCTVWNAFGQDSLQIYLYKQNSVPMLIVLSGVIGVIVFIVSVTIVIILCLRRKAAGKGDDYSSGKKTKQSDSTSSGDSDLKVEIRTASSLSNIETDHNWEDSNDKARTQDIYKFSTNYAELSFPPKPDIQSNNGYIPYVDYARDYSPPAVQPISTQESGLFDSPADLGQSGDPRYSAGYANPYLRTAHSNLPAPQGVFVTSWGDPTPGSTSPTSSTPPNCYIMAHHPQPHVKQGTLATHV